MTRKALYLLLASLLLVFQVLGAFQDRVPEDYAALEARAEEYYAEGSYELAHRLYERADALQLEAERARWVDFRLADTAWRSAAATGNADQGPLQQALEELHELLRGYESEEDHDRTWARIQESIADWHWTRQNMANWGLAWQHYQQALDWWAGDSDIELARSQYLSIAWRMTRPSWYQPTWDYGTYGNVLPVEIARNVVEIAQSPEDRARAHFLLAQTLQRTGSWQHRLHVQEHYEAALEVEPRTEWHDDALYNLAVWMEETGRITRTPQGGWETEPDYVRAAELLQRLLNEYSKGETRYYDSARERRKRIVDPDLAVSVDRGFLPGSEVVYELRWRNVERIELDLYPIDLTADVRFQAKNSGPHGYQEAIDLSGRQSVRSWVFPTRDTGKHVRGQEVVSFEEAPAPGAYLLVARAKGAVSRQLLLVSDLDLVAKISDEQALVFVCDTITGKPVEGAKVRQWIRHHVGNDYRWSSRDLATDADGLAFFPVLDYQRLGGVFLAASKGDRQSFALSNFYSSRSRSVQEEWKVFAYTDRPAYRPNDEVQWKLTARVRGAEGYATPSNAKLAYEIQDPRGEKVGEGELTLNAFGSAWATFPTTESMSLGEYQLRVSLVEDESRTQVGYATLFRLEEYKLPEFEVRVRVPQEDGPDGKGKVELFTLGDEVEIAIEATYYFGGPVTDATVEALVYQKPFHHWWHPERDFPWLYSDRESSTYRGGWGGWKGQLVSRQTLKTGEDGIARLSIETPADGGQDLEFTVEARVTDSSRREVAGSGSVRVTSQPYYVYPHLEHYIYEPGETIEAKFHAEDANGNAVQVEGTASLVRLKVTEAWIDPSGREIAGPELERLRSAYPDFPPLSRPGEPRWELKRRLVERELVEQTALATDAEGSATWKLVAPAIGQYELRWLSRTDEGQEITGETNVWVADRSSDLSWRSGVLDLIVDRESFRVGEEAALVVTVPASNRYVLFTVEAESLIEHRLLRLDGTAKLLRLPIQEKHVPNVYLGAILVQGGSVFEARAEVVVPPVRQFVDVSAELDQESYLPGTTGTMTITTLNHEGKPVPAEVGLSVYDSSVAAIQAEYPGDPREFFYGERRPLGVRTIGRFQALSYVNLERDEEGELVEKVAVLDMEVEGDDGRRYGMAKDGPGAPSSRSDGFFLGRQQEGLRELGYAGAPEERLAFDSTAMAGEAIGVAGGTGGTGTIEVRTDFRDTALWKPDVVTGPDGKARVEIPFPQSTTRWEARLRAATRGSSVGYETASARTRMPLIARLQAPRFFVVGDECMISGVFNNQTDAAMDVVPKLEVEGLELLGRMQGSELGADDSTPVNVPAGGDARVDWLVRATGVGEAAITLTGLSNEASDGMRRTYPVTPHGIEALLAVSGKLQHGELLASLDLPAERQPGRTDFLVQVQPSIAVTMLDALPYLVRYPYGCTEQTLSRFLPAAIVAKTLADRGLSPEDLAGRMFGGIEQEHVDETHEEETASLQKLDEVMRDGLKRLYDFQHDSGAWGWWKGGDDDAFMTAYVLWGLSLARDAGIQVSDAVLERAASYLEKELVEAEEAPDMAAWMLHALAAYEPAGAIPKDSSFISKAYTRLWGQRDRLNSYTRAIFALTAHRFGRAQDAQTLVRNLVNGVKIDERPDVSIVHRGAVPGQPTARPTAHWGEDGIYWRWSDGGVEATAFALRALLAIDPENELVEPVLTWLVRNRRGAQWKSTRDTAIVVLALNEYLEATGELEGSVRYAVQVNGEQIAEVSLSQEELISGPAAFHVAEEKLRNGRNEVLLRKLEGEGPLYLSVRASFFSLEEPIPARGNELFVRRDYFRLVGRPTLLKGYVYDRVRLSDGEQLESGDRVEVVISVEAKNHMEYLMFEDLKPAGLEAVELQSGGAFFARELQKSLAERRFVQGVGPGPRGSAAADMMPRWGWPSPEEGYTGRTRWVHRELRDRKVALFADRLPEGYWELRYDLRAEVPGTFHALPCIGSAMYVPEIRGNSEELRLQVVERGEAGGM